MNETIASNEKLSEALKLLEHAKEVSAEKVRKAAQAVDNQVHANPWPYIGGAAVIALLFGYILGRKR